MQSILLNISGYRIRLESKDVLLALQKKFEKFVIPDNSQGCDILIEITSGRATISDGSECIFNAPYVEEKNCEQKIISSDFWSIWRSGDNLSILTSFPGSRNEKAVLNFSLDSTKWFLKIETHEKTVDPLRYPIDGLILYYLTLTHRDILIHASGISYNGKGYIFSGVSGRGKSTIARLWHEIGAGVIHDDRLVLRKNTNGYTMYNTPVYENDEPSEAHVTEIFLIEHGLQNKSERIIGAAAISSVMSNCIQHNWGHKPVETLLGSVSDLCSLVPVYKMVFKPDVSVTEYIK